jgi:hypothetical protein
MTPGKKLQWLKRNNEAISYWMLIAMLLLVASTYKLAIDQCPFQPCCECQYIALPNTSLNLTSILENPYYKDRNYNKSDHDIHAHNSTEYNKTYSNPHDDLATNFGD